MDAQELRNLQEAYMEVVENQQLDEASRGDDEDEREWSHKVSRGRKKPTPRSSETLEPEKNPTGRYAAMQRRKRQGLSYREEQVDLYDIILSHLLDEGYAETVDAAEVMMVNMSEEWKEGILDERNRGERGMLDKEVRMRRDRRDGDTTTGGFKPYVRAGGSQRAEHERNRGRKKTKSGYGRTQWQ